MDHSNPDSSVPGFVPNRRELLLLYAYWAEQRLDLGFFRWCYHQVSSCDLRIERFAEQRMVMIEQALGNDPALEATFQEVETKYSANVRPLVWKVFIGKATEEEKRLEAIDHARSLGIDSTQGAEASFTPHRGWLEKVGIVSSSQTLKHIWKFSGICLR